MKLYYSRGACSLTPHILLREIEADFTLVRVDAKTHQTEDGTDYHTVNAKGYVPLLELDNGERLTEGPVVCQYICDQARRTDLMPEAGSLARYRVMEWQGYINSEIHKSYTILFDPSLDAAVKTKFAAALRKKYEWVDAQLADKEHLAGAAFTAADAYLYNVTRWARYVKLDVADLASLQAFMQRVASRDSVRAAAKAENIPV